MSADAGAEGKDPGERRQAGRLTLLALALFAALALVVALGAWRLLGQTGTGSISVIDRAQQPAPPQAARLSDSVLSSEDLPPPGTRSLFDHLVAQNDGLPYPFDQLVEMIRQQDPEGAAPVALTIPQGRSLLKGQADFHHPRVLVAADFQARDTPAALGIAPRGQLFLGFVENAGEIEVISYNEAAGRFEFQLVQDYTEHGQRRIVYARRAICTTCHQGGAPIFPQRPWNETSGQPEVAQKIRDARGGDQPYLGLPPAQPLAMPERFDELTDSGNFIAVTQRLWIDGCGGGADGVACRRLMLKLALRYAGDPGRFDAASAEAAMLRELQARAWPADGIAVPESDLRNRDPLAERRGLKGFFRNLLSPPPEPGEGARSNEDLAAFERLPKLPLELDPLTPRPPKKRLGAQDIDGVFGLAVLFTEDDLRLLGHRTDFVPARLDSSIDALPSAFFAPAPFSRVRTMQALLGVSGSPGGKASTAALAYCCLDTTEMSPPQASGIPPLALAADSPLQDYEDYCFACHRGNPAQRLDFMSGASEAAVLENLRAKAEIRDALDWERYRGTDQANKIMPPEDSPQRAKLEAALQKDPQLLQRMREQVPALFEF